MLKRFVIVTGLVCGIMNASHKPSNYTMQAPDTENKYGFVDPSNGKLYAGPGAGLVSNAPYIPCVNPNISTSKSNNSGLSAFLVGVQKGMISTPGKSPYSHIGGNSKGGYKTSGPNGYSQPYLPQDYCVTGCGIL